MDFNPESSID